MRLHKAGGSDVVNNLVVFAVCAPLVAIASEIYYRIVDLPGIGIASKLWTFMTE